MAAMHWHGGCAGLSCDCARDLPVAGVAEVLWLWLL